MTKTKGKKLLARLMNNVRVRRHALRLSQADLSHKCGWEAPARISNYENLTREPTLRDLEKIADALQVPLSELLFADTLETNTKLHYIAIPVLMIDEVPLYLSQTLSYQPRSFNMYISEINVRDKLLMVIAEGDAMVAPIPSQDSVFGGDGLLVRLDAEVLNNDIVLAKTPSGIKVRQFIKDGSDKFLRAFNPQYERLNLSDEIKIIGVVLEKHRSYRPNSP